MLAMPRLPAVASCLPALLAATITTAPVPAGEWQGRYLEPAIQAWMGAVTMLADETGRAGEQPERSADRGPQRRWMHSPDHPHHPPLGPPPGRRSEAMSMLADIAARLARIEEMLAARGAGGPRPGRSDAGKSRGAGEPGMPPEAREMRELMEARRARMQEARAKWEQASPEEREAMKQRLESRRKEVRERMEQARGEQGERPGTAEEMKRALERIREEGRRRIEEAKAKMDEARRRFQDMEARVKQLEAEVRRLKQAAAEDG